MSEINDADRRLLVCVAVAMEPEPWGMSGGGGCRTPSSPLSGGVPGKMVLTNTPAAPAGDGGALGILPPPVTRVWERWSCSQEVATVLFRVYDNLETCRTEAFC